MPLGSDAHLAIFGRFRTPAGRISDVAVEPERLAKAVSLLPTDASLEHLLVRAANLMAEHCPPLSRPIAIIGVGFGPAPPDAGATWWKGDFDESNHPRWPRNDPDGRGGQFRSNDDPGGADGDDERKARLKEQLARRAARREIRIKIMAGLRVAALAVTNVIPGVGEADDVLIAADLMLTAAELHQLRVETAAALAFASHAPYTLDELRVTSEYESFSSHDAFTKDLQGKRFGRAGDGYQYHHIVEQGGENEANIPPDRLHNTENVVRIPTLVHEAINAKMYDTAPGTDMTYREWLPLQPYEIQRATGIKIMRELGILR